MTPAAAPMAMPRHFIVRSNDRVERPATMTVPRKTLHDLKASRAYQLSLLTRTKSR